FDELLAALAEAQPALENAGELDGAARCERARAQLAWALGQATEAHAAARRCYDLLRRAGSTAFQSELVAAVSLAAIYAGLPLSEVRAELEAFQSDLGNPGQLLGSSLRLGAARVDFQTGRLSGERTREIAEDHAELLRQTGSPMEAELASSISLTVFVEGDDVAFEAAQRARLARFEALANHQYTVHELAQWAAAVCAIGDHETALDAILRGRTKVRPDDVVDNVALDYGEAFARALQGDDAGARALVERARGRLGEVDMPPVTEWELYKEARVLAALGDIDSARATLESVVESAERREATRLADRFRRDLASLG
ncbi:MAG: hypothetical protein ACRC50_07110, partial [Gaiella sp.]